MGYMSPVTKRDIIDIVKHGLPNADALYPYYGDMTEIEFLSRIYELDKMPSNDSRFNTAIDDIFQHTCRNDDWDEYWVFDDNRFRLRTEDENLLKFLCEFLNPFVRTEDKEIIEAYFKVINDLLSVDGYVLYEKNSISGHPVYSFKRLESIEIIRNDSIEFANLKMIGEGSYANVYKYKDPFLSEKFALKKAKKDLSAEELLRFEEEFEQLKDLNSPYVVKVFSYNEERNYYLMEYMDSTLFDYINKNNSVLSIEIRKKIGLQILAGYEYLHSKKLLHRDVGWKNVLIKEYDDVAIVKLSDFGLVKLPESDLTRTNTDVKGIIHDPSLVTRGYKKYDVFDEIYSVTFLLVFVLTGKTNLENVSEKKPFCDLIDGGMTPVRKNRYKTIGELRNAFLSCISSLGE